MCIKSVRYYNDLLQNVWLGVGWQQQTINNTMLKRKYKIMMLVHFILRPCIKWMFCCLEGKPNVLRNTSYEFLKQQDGYFIIIRIITFNKHFDFPLTSKINEDTGVIYFINEMDNQIIYVDKVSLEDLVTFHDAQFELFDCYYYTDGRSENINHVIEYLYNFRLKLKEHMRIQQRWLLHYL